MARLTAPRTQSEQAAANRRISVPLVPQTAYRTNRPGRHALKDLTPHPRSATSAWQLRQDLLVGGETTRSVFRVDEFPVHNDIENAAPAFDQFGFDTGCLFNCVRQTDGLECVVSLHTVFDRNLHSFVSNRFLNSSRIPSATIPGYPRRAGRSCATRWLVCLSPHRSMNHAAYCSLQTAETEVPNAGLCRSHKNGRTTRRIHKHGAGGEFPGDGR